MKKTRYSVLSTDKNIPIRTPNTNYCINSPLRCGNKPLQVTGFCTEVIVQWWTEIIILPCHEDVEESWCKLQVFVSTEAMVPKQTGKN